MTNRGEAGRSDFEPRGSHAGYDPGDEDTAIGPPVHFCSAFTFPHFCPPAHRDGQFR
jgi:hypothetical protein